MEVAYSSTPKKGRRERGGGPRIYKQFALVECGVRCVSVIAFRRCSTESLAHREYFIARLQYLNAEEITSDPFWSEAVIVSTDRKTVHYVNEIRVLQFAAQSNQPVSLGKFHSKDITQGRCRPIR